jgi:hypothetical protein
LKKIKIKKKQKTKNNQTNKKHHDLVGLTGSPSGWKSESERVKNFTQGDGSLRRMKSFATPIFWIWSQHIPRWAGKLQYPHMQVGTPQIRAWNSPAAAAKIHRVRPGESIQELDNAAALSRHSHSSVHRFLTFLSAPSPPSSGMYPLFLRGVVLAVFGCEVGFSVRSFVVGFFWGVCRREGCHGVWELGFGAGWE